MATAPVRVGIAAADAGLAVAGMALRFVKESTGYQTSQTTDPITTTCSCARRDRRRQTGQPSSLRTTGQWGRILARGGPADKLTRRVGCWTWMAAPGGRSISVEAVRWSGCWSRAGSGSAARRGRPARADVRPRRHHPSGCSPTTASWTNWTVKNGPLEQHSPKPRKSSVGCSRPWRLTAYRNAGCCRHPQQGWSPRSSAITGRIPRRRPRSNGLQPGEGSGRHRSASPRRGRWGRAPSPPAAGGRIVRQGGGGRAGRGGDQCWGPEFDCGPG